MQIIDTILQTDYFNHQPPVLVDIGASGEINQKWERIAPYSVCIAFDADDREFHITEQVNKTYKKLITFNRIVTAVPVDQTDFYLTRSPFCSSLLEPDNVSLQPWLFNSLFEVEKKTSLPAITIEQALSQIKVDYIDWFKTDTQGTDLRLFKTLPVHIADQIQVAEFEPGIIDAYKREDKLYMVMEYMSQKEFWLSSMELKGTQRLNSSYESKIGSRLVKKILRKPPCWAEVTYLRQPLSKNKRQLLLLYIFALLEKQYGYALEIADVALQNFSDSIFTDCKIAILKKIKGEKWKVPFAIGKRQFNKLFSFIND